MGMPIHAWHLSLVVGVSTIGMALLLYGSEPTDVEGPLLAEGALPVLPAQTAGGGEVLLEVGVNELGFVDDIVVLTDTPPFTERVREAVGAWRFHPARSEDGPQQGRVLVAGLYRAPTLFSGTTAGTASVVLGESSPEIPYPIQTLTPSYPPLASGAGQALLEIAVAESGEVEDARLLRATPGFENTSLDALRRWRFRPAERAGLSIPATVWVILAYPQPTVP
jgi:TonB family protein